MFTQDMAPLFLIVGQNVFIQKVNVITGSGSN